MKNKFDGDELKLLSDAAKSISKKAGVFVNDHWKPSMRNFSYKQGREIITEVDLKAQELIVKEILDLFPSHGILAEEGGMDSEGESGYRWVIDPIDGTTNFAHSYPCFCVSIGVEYLGEVVVGAVYDPTRQEMFSASKGNGAFLNSEPITVSDTGLLSESLLCTGFPYDILSTQENNIKEFNKMILCSHGIRRDGSAALDLCYVACGRFDGFWEIKLKPWDVAAGIIIMSEAGGKLTNYNGEEYKYHQPVLATNGKIHEEMMKNLRE